MPFVPSSPMLFPSLSEQLPETMSLLGGNAKKSCSQSAGVRQADLWGKILKELNTHSLAQQLGWRMGEHLSQAGNIRDESTLRSTSRRGQNAKFILGRTHRHSVTCQLTQGALCIYIFEFLQFCDAINNSLGRITEHYSEKTPQEFSFITLNQYIFNFFVKL